MMTNQVESTRNYQQPISKNKLLGIAGLAWMFDAMDVGILSFVIAALAVEWGLTPDKWDG